VTNNVLLDNVTHKDLKILTNRGDAFGDNFGYAVIVPREYRQAAFCYPIVFRKTATNNQYEAVALFGFNEKENLFLNAGEWEADYIPLSVERIPFMIGYVNDHSTVQQQAMIHIDMDSPRISSTEGADVFLPHGGNAPYLEHINSVLAELLKGLTVSKQFIDMLLTENLLEPFTLKIQLEDSSTIEVKGFSTINEEKLRSLSANQLEKLHKENFLELIYMAIASLTNIRKMIDVKQRMSRF
jgi:hypothetical protein